MMHASSHHTPSHPHHASPEASPVQVIVRLRPATVPSATSIATISPDMRTLTLHKDDTTSREGPLQHVFLFDRVFDGFTSQAQFYAKCIHPMVSAAVQGVNGTILCYGHTRSGRGYTLEGTRDNSGMLPRAVESLLRYANEMAKTIHVTLRATHIQVHPNDAVLDLLESGPGAEKPPINTTVAAGGSQLSQWEIISIADIYRIMGRMDQTQSRRAMDKRSHFITTIIIEQKSLQSPSGTEPKHLLSKLNFVNMAGAEKADDHQRYSTKSLTALMSVLSQLQKGSAHIPYRDSKLTFLLRESLLQNSLCLFVATMQDSPDHFLESLKVVKSAKRIKQVSTPSSASLLVGRFDQVHKHLVPSQPTSREPSPQPPPPQPHPQPGSKGLQVGYPYLAGDPLIKATPTNNGGFGQPRIEHPPLRTLSRRGSQNSDHSPGPKDMQSTLTLTQSPTPTPVYTMSPNNRYQPTSSSTGGDPNPSHRMEHALDGTESHASQSPGKGMTSADLTGFYGNSPPTALRTLTTDPATHDQPATRYDNEHLEEASGHSPSLSKRIGFIDGLEEVKENGALAHALLECNQLSKEKETLVNELEGVRHELQLSQHRGEAQTQFWHQKVKALEVEVEKRSQAVESLQKTLVSQQMDSQITNKDVMCDDLIATKNDLLATRTKRDDYHRQLEATKNQLQAEQDKRRAAEIEVDHLKLELSRVKLDQQSLRQTVLSSKHQIASLTDDLNEAQIKVEASQTEAGSKEDEIARLVSQMASLRAENTQLGREISTLNQQLVGMPQIGTHKDPGPVIERPFSSHLTLSTSENSASALSKDVKSLQREFLQVMEERDALRRDLADLTKARQQQVDVLTLSKSSHEQEYQHGMMDALELRVLQAHFERALEDKVIAFKSLLECRYDLRRVYEEKESLAQELYSAQQMDPPPGIPAVKVMQALQDREHIEKDLQTMTIQWQTKYDECQSVSLEVADLRLEVQRLREINTQLIRHVESNTQRQAEAITSKDDLKTTNRQLELECQNMQQQHVRMQNRIAHLEGQEALVEDMKDQVARLTATVKRSSEDQEALKEEAEAKRKQLNDVRNYIKELENKVVLSRQQVEESKAALHESELEVEELKATTISLRRENERLEGQCQAVTDMCRNEDAHWKSLEAQLRVESASRTATEEHVRELMVRTRTLEAEYAAMGQELEEAQIRYNTATRAVEEAQDRQKESESRWKTLNEQYTQCQTQLETLMHEGQAKEIEMKILKGQADKQKMTRTQIIYFHETIQSLIQIAGLKDCQPPGDDVDQLFEVCGRIKTHIGKAMAEHKQLHQECDAYKARIQSMTVENETHLKNMATLEAKIQTNQTEHMILAQELQRLKETSQGRVSNGHDDRHDHNHGRHSPHTMGVPEDKKSYSTKTSSKNPASSTAFSTASGKNPASSTASSTASGKNPASPTVSPTASPARPVTPSKSALESHTFGTPPTSTSTPSQRFPSHNKTSAYSPSSRLLLSPTSTTNPFHKKYIPSSTAKSTTPTSSTTLTSSAIHTTPPHKDTPRPAPNSSPATGSLTYGNTRTSHTTSMDIHSHTHTTHTTSIDAYRSSSNATSNHLESTSTSSSLNVPSSIPTHHTSSGSISSHHAPSASSSSHHAPSTSSSSHGRFSTLTTAHNQLSTSTTTPSPLGSHVGSSTVTTAHSPLPTSTSVGTSDGTYLKSSIGPSAVQTQSIPLYHHTYHTPVRSSPNDFKGGLESTSGALSLASLRGSSVASMGNSSMKDYDSQSSAHSSIARGYRSGTPEMRPQPLDRLKAAGIRTPRSHDTKRFSLEGSQSSTTSKAKSKGSPQKSMSYSTQSLIQELERTEKELQRVKQPMTTAELQTLTDTLCPSGNP